MAKARPGDLRTLEDPRGHCGKYGSREFTVSRLQKRSVAHAFMMRNN